MSMELLSLAGYSRPGFAIIAVDRVPRTQTGMHKNTPSESPKPGDSPDKLNLIRNHFLFSHLAAGAMQQLASRMTRKAVRRGTIIFAKDDPGIGLIGVIRGSVKISVVAADGREAMLNIINSGEVFGEMALLDGRPRSADATAMSDCELVSIDRGAFVSILRGDPDVALKVIEILCARLRHSSDQLQDVMYLSAPARLAKTLLQLVTEPTSAGSVQQAKITQREISQIVGLSREMTNKQLRMWERLRWVKLERGAVVLLQSGQLQKIAAEAIDSV
jgi:CRP/FNR family transcriptional regulator, cyclic AMP receptor protein